MKSLNNRKYILIAILGLIGSMLLMVNANQFIAVASIIPFSTSLCYLILKILNNIPNQYINKK